MRLFRIVRYPLQEIFSYVAKDEKGIALFIFRPGIVIKGLFVFIDPANKCSLWHTICGIFDNWKRGMRVTSVQMSGLPSAGRSSGGGRAILPGSIQDHWCYRCHANNILAEILADRDFPPCEGTGV
jgi:hypothetical protein